MEKKDDSKTCIMIVPHTKKIKKFILPHWATKIIIGSLITTILTITISIYNISTSNKSLEEKYYNKTLQISDLKDQNKNKETELKELQAHTKELNEKSNDIQEKSNEIQEKLDEIDKLKITLEKMTKTKSPSRGGSTRRKINQKNLEPDKQMDVLADVLDDTKLELETFIGDIETKFQQLEHIPDLYPTQGRITSKFGNRRNPFGKNIKFHQGIDLANSSGTKIVASGKGVVSFSGYKGGYGKAIIIDHGNGYKTLYGHCRKLLIKTGDSVEKGDSIAEMGSTGRSTGPHLHFEIHKEGTLMDPLEILQ